jgi:hypothetical protein
MQNVQPRHDAPIPCDALRLRTVNGKLWAHITDDNGVSRMPYGTYLRLNALREIRTQQANHEWSCI